jgi:hypothetical protein
MTDAPTQTPQRDAPELEPVTCADCGRLGLEHWTDPMPGVCTRCMDARLLPVAAGLSRDVFRKVAPGRIMRNHYQRLLDAGMRPAAASFDVRRLCDASGYPVPKEALATADAGWDRATEAYLASFAEADAAREARP